MRMTLTSDSGSASRRRQGGTGRGCSIVLSRCETHVGTSRSTPSVRLAWALLSRHLACLDRAKGDSRVAPAFVVRGTATRKTAGFLVATGTQSATTHPAPETHPKITARLTPGSVSFWNQGLSPSHLFCVDLDDLAFVSPIARSVSRSVRRRPPPVSTNVRWKRPSISRSPHFDLAPLQIVAHTLLSVSGAEAPRQVVSPGGQALCRYSWRSNVTRSSTKAC